jgi:hypothetical protein
MAAGISRMTYNLGYARCLVVSSSCQVLSIHIFSVKGKELKLDERMRTTGIKVCSVRIMRLLELVFKCGVKTVMHLHLQVDQTTHDAIKTSQGTNN